MNVKECGIESGRSLNNEEVIKGVFDDLLDFQYLCDETDKLNFGSSTIPDDKNVGSASEKSILTNGRSDQVENTVSNHNDQKFSSEENHNDNKNYYHSHNLVNIITSSRILTSKIKPEDFTLLSVIGKGTYGKVMLVRYSANNRLYAMKMLRKDNIIEKNQVEHTRTERSVLQSINHPFIVRLFYAFQTPKKLYLVLEYCAGGELFFHLSRAGTFSEEMARFYSAEIILALEHLHKYNIIYRDLKPENVLLDEEGHIRITDFGLSKEGVEDNFSAKSVCGTPEYLAPEIISQKGHGKAVDWWNLGALIYEMLTGSPPFYYRDKQKIFEGIQKEELEYPPNLSDSVVSLLRGLLQKDPNKRLGSSSKDAEDIKNHRFYRLIDWKSLLEKKVKPEFRPKILNQTDVQNFSDDFVKLPINDGDVGSTMEMKKDKVDGCDDKYNMCCKKDEFDHTMLNVSNNSLNNMSLFQGFTYEGKEDY